MKGDNKVDFTLTESVINLNAVDVTALKSKTTLAMQTPMAITVFSGKTIEKMDYYSISDFIQQSPGVTTTQLDEAYMNVQIRGISSMAGGSAAGYYLDDVPFSFINSPLVPDVNPYDLDRIEILRGPQGTLYGNGAMSGVVRILTDNANLSKFGFKVDLAAAATLHGGPDYEGQGELNVPIVKEKLGIRLTGGYLERGGFLTNNMLNRSEVNQAKLYYFRGKINYQATKRLSIRASYWTQNNNVGTLSLADDNFDRSNPFEDEANKNNFNLYNLTIEYKLPKLHFYSATSYVDLDATQNDGSPIFARSDTHLGQTAFSEEFRMNSVYKGHFNWLAGFYVWDVNFNQTTNITYALPTGGLMTVPYLETTTTSLQFAGFGELYYKFLQDRMTATAGLRYFHEKTDLEDKVPATVDFLNMLGLSAKRGMKTDHFSPRFNLAFNITPKSMLYLTASNGFRSGFVQSGAFYASAVAFGKPAPESVGNENLWSYELGTKVTTGRDRFTIEAAVYYNDWKGLIQTTSELIIVDSTITPIIYYINAGNASALGLDMNAQYSFPFGLSLGLGGNVNKSQYDEDTPASIGAKKGDRISFVPLYTLSASVNFVHKI
ncbi:MAG: TonB-dependent receptor, partial [Bacteroidota bacterium]